jgi:hypothetical protein
MILCPPIFATGKEYRRLAKIVRVLRKSAHNKVHRILAPGSIQQEISHAAQRFLSKTSTAPPANGFALANRLSDEEMQTKVGEHWTVAVVFAHIAF